MYLTISLFILLGAIALQDLKKMMVHDLLIIMLWFLAIFYGDTYILVISFTFLWLINTISKIKMGWADILGLPPLASLFIFIPYNHIIIALVSTLGVIMLCYTMNKKREVPLYPFVFYFYFITLLISLIGGI